MKRWFHLAAGVAVVWICTASAFATDMWEWTHVWAIKGPGGYFGLAERQLLPNEVGAPRCETFVCLGPVQAKLPCSALTTACMLGIVVLAATAFFLKALRVYGRTTHEKTTG